MTGRSALIFGTIVPGLVMLIFFFVSSGISNPFIRPAWELSNTIGRELDGEFLSRHLLATISTASSGYAIGSVVGLALGFLISLSPFLYQAFYPVMIWARATPNAAIVPVAIAALGFGSSTIVFLVCLTTFLNVAVTTGLALSQTKKDYLDVAKVYRFSAGEKLLLVRFGANLRNLVVGLQAGLQSAIGITLLAEALSSDTGLGAYILISLRTFRLDNLWFALVAIGMIGVIFNAIFHLLERSVPGASHG
jgi:ABC-type nitrate/sulfonate/bicarbonate transport system permease component